MGEYYTDTNAFSGYIMAEFKFNILEVFSQHFKVHNSVVLSFKHNEIIIQTMCSNDADVDIRGFYTTRIPSESLEEYEFECNIPEVNVIVTSLSMRSTSKVAGGCKNINVVPSGFLLINEMTKPLVEVSFDLYKNSKRKRKVVDELDSYDDDGDITSSGTTSKIFGRVC